MIATRNRLEKLKRCLRSIEPAAKGLKIIVNVTCDGERQTLDFLARHQRQFNMVDKITATTRRVGAVSCRNAIICKTKDGVLYATDDMTFEPNSIVRAFNTFNDHFRDEDGVVGFRQIPADHHPTGVALVGSAFLDRYEDRQLFYPGYSHFACQEIHWLAKKLGRFVQEKRAVIRHFHPVFFPREMDRTHHEARAQKNADMMLLARRQRKGLIWGLQ